MSFLEKSIETWPSMIRSLVFLTAILIGLYFFLTFLSTSINPNSVSISTDGGISVSFGDNQVLNSLQVHPRGWQATDIYVHKGDLVTLDASGSIHIAMGRMVESLSKQYLYKDTNKSRSIEEFTQEQLNESTFAYPWNPPSGIDLKSLRDSTAIKRIKSLQKNRVYPTAAVGQLLMVIGQSNIEYPVIEESQVVPFQSSSHKITIKDNGYIWFIINDEKYRNDNVLDNIIWQDNIGSFNVEVLKTKG